MEASVLQKEINEVGFEADRAGDLEYQVQGFEVLADNPEDMSASELGAVETGLDDLVSELNALIGSIESARDELQAISGRCWQAQEEIEEGENDG